MPLSTGTSQPPRISQSKRKVAWIGTSNVPTGLNDLIHGITAHEIDDAWIDAVYQHIDEPVDLIHPHPSATVDPLKKISNLHDIPTALFDINKVNVDDKFIFHSINCSLIYYCLKFDLEFIIYTPRFTTALYTPYFYSFIELLERKGNIQYI